MNPPEPTTTSLNAVTSPITFGSETTETFTGTVSGQSGDGNPEGTVTVYYGTPTATQLCTSNLTASGANAATFSCALTASQLTVGTYASVDAVFAPAGTSSTEHQLHLHGLDVEPGAELQREPGVGEHHDVVECADLARHLWQRDHRDLQRHGERPER